VEPSSLYDMPNRKMGETRMEIQTSMDILLLDLRSSI
jgi:hypothetical protein